MSLFVEAVDRPEVPRHAMPDRFRHEITYFMSLPGESGAPSLPSGEYWISQENARNWLEDGVFLLLSPLDSQNQTEIELSEEQEDWLRWLVEHRVERVRLV